MTKEYLTAHAQTDLYIDPQTPFRYPSRMACVSQFEIGRKGILFLSDALFCDRVKHECSVSLLLLYLLFVLACVHLWRVLSHRMFSQVTFRPYSRLHLFTLVYSIEGAKAKKKGGLPNFGATLGGHFHFTM